MYKTEPFLPEQLFSLDLVNLDGVTDNYSFLYYLHYFLNHSEEMYAIKTDVTRESNYFVYREEIVGYVIGKIEQQKKTASFLDSLKGFFRSSQDKDLDKNKNNIKSNNQNNIENNSDNKSNKNNINNSNNINNNKNNNNNINIKNNSKSNNIEKNSKNNFFSVHISALSIAPSHRNCGLATFLCDLLSVPDALFIDLFVRQSNESAIRFYESIGYVKYRAIYQYYSSPGEDAWDMRKFGTLPPCKGTNIPVRKLFE